MTKIQNGDRKEFSRKIKKKKKKINSINEKIILIKVNYNNDWQNPQRIKPKLKIKS